MKKLISLILAAAMILSLAACGGTQKNDSGNAGNTQMQTSNTPSDSGNNAGEVELPAYKIAVAFTQINANALIQQKYLKEYVGPAFNVEFMFSEAVEDADSLMTFIENAYASGCQAIMNFQNSSVEQANAKANELGMYILTNSPPAENTDLPYCLGNMAPSTKYIAGLFSDVVKDFTSDGEKHNVVIVSAGAGLGNEQHYESTYAILEALKDVYNLNYSDSIENLAASRGLLEVETGSDVKILIYPGYPNSDTYVSGLSSILQTGEYDIVLGCNQATSKFAVAIDEVERAYKMNVKVATVASIDDSTKASFETIDSAGDSSINTAMVLPCCSLVGSMFAVLYNGMSGHADVMKVDGAGYYFHNPFWSAKDASVYQSIAQLNAGEDTYEMSIDDIKEMLCIYNPDANYESIQAQMDAMTAENVLAARGLS